MRKNIIGGLLKLIGILAIAGSLLIAGIFSESLRGDVKLMVNIAIWVSGFISGMIFIGFGEIIDQLHELNYKIGQPE